jgi:hypothetical protein
MNTTVTFGFGLFAVLAVILALSLLNFIATLEILQLMRRILSRFGSREKPER